MNKKITVLSELIENSSEVNRLLISNAIAMENGEIVEAQNSLKQATVLLSVMIRDVFLEVKEILDVSSDEEELYDFSMLDIAKLLSKVSFNASTLINCYLNNDIGCIKDSIEKRLVKCINATKSLTLAILLN